jgi:hypothetical protein
MMWAVQVVREAKPLDDDARAFLDRHKGKALDGTHRPPTSAGCTRVVLTKRGVSVQRWWSACATARRCS